MNKITLSGWCLLSMTSVLSINGAAYIYGHQIKEGMIVAQSIKSLAEVEISDNRRIRETRKTQAAIWGCRSIAKYEEK